MKDYIVIKLLLSVLLVSMLLSSCSQQLDTAIQDLSRATPIVAVTREEGASSYVKVKGEPVDSSEETTEKYNEIGLDKRVYKEGDIIEFDPVGIDPDGDIITYSYSLPLDKNGKWQTTVGDEGTYIVTITASDGKTSVEKKVLLLILSVNRAPTIDNLKDITANEGDLIMLEPRIFDYNSDDVTVLFSKPFNVNGEWQTDYESAGTYLVKVSASDSETTTEKQIMVVVKETNRAPLLYPIEHVSVLAGETIKFDAKATDSDNDPVTITYSAPFNSDGVWTPTEADLGTYAITVKASDGKNTTEKLVTVIVNHRNMAPVILIEEEIRAEETDRLTLKPSIIDPEGNDFTVTYSEPFDQNRTWVTDYDSAGTYDVTITATDKEGASASATVKIVIYDRNRPPEFTLRT